MIGMVTNKEISLIFSSQPLWAFQTQQESSVIAEAIAVIHIEILWNLRDSNLPIIIIFLKSSRITRESEAQYVNCKEK